MSDIEFTPTQVPTDCGSVMTREVHVIAETDDCLGLQVKRCIEGDVYFPLHVPSGAIMAVRYGYQKADDAKAALMEFWGRLDVRQRFEMAMRDPSNLERDASLAAMFFDCWDGDVRVTETGMG